MTRLILPTEQDPIVNRMIQSIELQRVDAAPDPGVTLVHESPPPIEEESPLIAPRRIAEESVQPTSDEAITDPEADDDPPSQVIDWWAQARSFTQESDDEVFQRWLLEQGHDRYVSIMQGPLPITNPVRGTYSDREEIGSVFINSYGDKEIKISENCFAQIQAATPFAMSDFDRALPMQIFCKSAPKTKLSFDRGDRE